MPPKQSSQNPRKRAVDTHEQRNAKRISMSSSTEAALSGIASLNEYPLPDSMDFEASVATSASSVDRSYFTLRGSGTSKTQAAWDVPVPDRLSKLPPPNYSYITEDGLLKDPDKYASVKQFPDEVPHPRLAAHISKGTDSRALHIYYAGMPHQHTLPLAGTHREQIAHDSLSRNYTRSAMKNRILTVSQEAEFHSRPSIKIPIPDHIKAILVDDWENVTKNQQLVPLPHPTSVNVILDAYHELEMPKRQPGSAQADILDEFVAGLREYFNKSLGRILLYR